MDVRMPCALKDGSGQGEVEREGVSGVVIVWRSLNINQMQ